MCNTHASLSAILNILKNTRFFVLVTEAKYQLAVKNRDADSSIIPGYLPAMQIINRNNAPIVQGDEK